MISCRQSSIKESVNYFWKHETLVLLDSLSLTHTHTQISTHTAHIRQPEQATITTTQADFSVWFTELKPVL